MPALPPIPSAEDLRAGLAGVMNAQRTWAEGRGLAVDDAGYVATADENLFRPLSAAARAACERGAGGELRDRGPRPAKMRALISSSALAINVFDYWTGRDKGALAAGLGVPVHGDPGFEVPFPTVMRGTPPHLDVVMASDGPLLAIESKFAEWLRPHRPHAESLAPYLAQGRTVWTDARMPECQRLAAELGAGGGDYHLLDVPQLLKHALGLAGAATGYRLMILYHDVPGVAGERFAWELSAFGERCGHELGFGFHALPYHRLVDRLSAAAGGDHTDYLAYLSARYRSSPRMGADPVAAVPS